ncbi:hypothetical protein [Mesorhizobium sp. A623]
MRRPTDALLQRFNVVRVVFLAMEDNDPPCGANDVLEPDSVAMQDINVAAGRHLARKDDAPPEKIDEPLSESCHLAGDRNDGRSELQGPQSIVKPDGTGIHDLGDHEDGCHINRIWRIGRPADHAHKMTDECLPLGFVEFFRAAGSCRRRRLLFDGATNEHALVREHELVLIFEVGNVGPIGNGCPATTPLKHSRDLDLRLSVDCRTRCEDPNLAVADDARLGNKDPGLYGAVDRDDFASTP